MELTNDDHHTHNRQSHISRSDRISTLPDPIILHILSFLDATYVVLASSLSRRFRSLDYSFISSLSFSYDTYLTKQRYRYDKFELFTTFVDRFSSRFVKSSNSIFKFAYDGGRRPHQFMGPERLSLLLSKGGADRAEEVELVAPFHAVIPDCLYANPRLKVLKVAAEGITMSGDQAFESLKELHLAEFKLSDKFDWELLTRYKNLEVLKLQSEGIEVSNIDQAFESLKVLELIGFILSGEKKMFSNCKNLESLSLVNCLVVMVDNDMKRLCSMKTYCPELQPTLTSWMKR